MANPEIELLSKIVATGDMSTPRRANLTAGTFQTEEGKLVFQWLHDQFHDQAHLGEVPDEARLRRHWPSFPFHVGRNSVDALIHEVMANRTRTDLNALTLELQALLEEGEEPSLVLGAMLPRFRDLNSQGARNDGLLISGSAARLRHEYETKEKHGGVTGVPWPWAPLNEATCGIQPENFIVIYGRPKQMKSWQAIKVAVHAYQSGRRVLVYSRELAKEDMERRAASIVGEIDYELLKKGKLSPTARDEFFELLNALAEEEKMQQQGDRKPAMLFIGDTDAKGGTVDYVGAQAEKFGADLIIVDGFYLMRDGRTNKRTADWQQITHISQDLKALARQLKTPIIGTTQANRASNATHGDDLNELSFADSIGMDADLVMRCFKGVAPDGKCAVMFTFPGMRDGMQIPPFVINARPGADFSILQTSVDVGAFLKDAKRVNGEDDKGPAPTGKPPAASGKKRPSPFRV